MSLPAGQQALLNGVDRALEARDPRLAAMFAIFTKLTSDDGPPRTERLERASRPVLVWLRVPVRWAQASVAIPIVLVAGLMAAIIALGIATSTGSACTSATVHRAAGAAGLAGCRSSAKG